MAPIDLQEFLFELEKKEEVLRIKETVSPGLEISFLTQEVCRRRGPALIFESFKIPVLTNAFGSMKRMCVALGINDVEETGAVFRDFLNTPERYKPSVIDSSPSCQEILKKGDEIDIFSLPLIKAWPKDAGPSVTLPVVITKDPETGRTNAGIYRLQAFDRKTTGLHWRKGSGGERHHALHKKMGKKMEVAVAIGPSPRVTFAASAPLPNDLEEFSFAGHFGKMSIEMARCLTIDMEVPASSQIVLEGYVEQEEKRWEGPFGNHTGYYDPGGEYPVFHITCITMRKDAIYPATIVGPPPQEDCYLAKASEPILLKIIQDEFPEIVDINLPLEGIFNNLLILSMDKRYPGHGKELLKALRAKGPLSRFKIISIFDKDVDIRDFSRVLWKAVNNMEPSQDIFIRKGDDSSYLDLDFTKTWEDESPSKKRFARGVGMSMDKDVAMRVSEILKKAGYFDGR